MEESEHASADGACGDADGGDGAGESGPPTCYICGLRATKSCGKCRRVHYCGKEHQIFHWTAGLHKQLCEAGAEGSSNKKAAHDLEEADQRKISACLYPMYEIISEQEEPIPEDDDENRGDNINDGDDDDAVEELEVNGGDDSQLLTDDLKRQLNIDVDGEIDGNENEAKQHETVEEEDEWDEEVFEEASAAVLDQQFLHFQKRIRHDPDQILRYLILIYSNRI